MWSKRDEFRSGKETDVKTNVSTQDGRKGRLEEKTKGYYRRVEEKLKSGFDNATDKDLFLENVFTNLCKEAMLVSQNQSVSGIVETLLQEAKPKQLVAFASVMSKDWELACTDRFASHATQALLKQAALRQNEDKESNKALIKIITDIYSFLMSDLALHMQDVYASHIVRVLLEVLAGVVVSDKIVRSRVARKGKGVDKAGSDNVGSNVHFSSLLREICNKMTSLKHMKDHFKNRLSNPVLQTMILVLQVRNPAQCQEACQKLIDGTELFVSVENTDEVADSKTQASLPDLLTDKIGSHFVEQLLVVADDEMFESIFQQLKSKFLTMALHPLANFILQRIIEFCHNSAQFKSIYKKIHHYFEDILMRNHNHVLIKLTEGCIKHATKQDNLVQHLLKAFHCYEPPERQLHCVQLFASLTTYDTYVGADKMDMEEANDIPKISNISFHGSLLLQQLIQFDDHKVITKSLLQLNPADLRFIACDRNGNHVLDVFMKSGEFGDQHRKLLSKALQGLYLELACDVNGSRALETVFENTKLKFKIIIAEELTKHKEKLMGNKFGRILWFKYGLASFMCKPNEWETLQAGQSKKRKMFEDIFEKENCKSGGKRSRSDDADKNQSDTTGHKQESTQKAKKKKKKKKNKA